MLHPEKKLLRHPCRLPRLVMLGNSYLGTLKLEQVETGIRPNDPEGSRHYGKFAKRGTKMANYSHTIAFYSLQIHK